jgi:glutamate formiminotransferase / formiminotetrahydrofolate cyclodeaminase
MSRFECVPNFSEGRDKGRVESIVAEAREIPGVTVLDVELNVDHNRSVVSLVGDGEPLLEAAFRMIRKAAEVIDLRKHRGEHPRMGAADVVPFIPLGEATMADAIALAERLGQRVWSELHVPVYLYGMAARRPERADLAVVRAGGFEGLLEAVKTDPARRPDFGEAELHPTAGAVAIGARPVLIAYNAYLTSPDVGIAKKVAHSVRARDGGLAEVKALGFEIKERNRAQVSMNLTDYRKTPIHRALEAVRREAARYGAAVEESEVVGLVPEDALLDAAEFYLQLNQFSRDQILERKIGGETARPPGETPTRTSTNLQRLSVQEFLARVAARTPTPGGGSVAAIAGAMGTALGEMVVAYSTPVKQTPSASLAALAKELIEGRGTFLELANADTDAYEAVRSARRDRKSKPEDPTAQRAFLDALQRAAEVPLQTARLARRLQSQLEAHREVTNPILGPDFVSGLALLRAAADSALANVSMNLADLREAGVPVADLEAERDRLSGHA